MKMHIGIVSPISTAQLSSYFEIQDSVPAGTEGATAPNLLIIELLKRGYKVSVFSLSREIEKEVVLHGEKITIYFLPQRRRPRNYIKDFYRKERKLLKYKIQQIKPDILHAHWQYEYSWGALDSGIKTIVTCRDSPVKVLLLYRNLYRFLRLLIAYVVIKKAKIITATSSYLANEMVKFGVKNPILVIPNFEPDWLFEMECIMNKDLDNPKIIMINNGFDERKNVKVGIEAFQIFRNKFPRAELHLYGHGYEKNGKAFEWASNNNLNLNVFYQGYMDFNSLMQKLNNFTMLIHPSKEETFGNILTESMALGVPVIGGKNSGSVPWVIGEDQTGGLLVDINSAEDIANGMIKILKDRATYELFSVNARIYAKENFSADNVINEYISLYNLHLESEDVG